ncbi:hypothetical protein C8Q76DRAFT_693602 [Earliella scabrosa]|nr:hypothetical protein C8Q76DRAFT_693602 [Earliella scabrosa]
MAYRSLPSPDSLSSLTTSDESEQNVAISGEGYIECPESAASDGDISAVTSPTTNTFPGISSGYSSDIASPKPMLATKGCFNVDPTISFLNTGVHAGDRRHDSTSYGDTIADQIRMASMHYCRTSLANASANVTRPTLHLDYPVSYQRGLDPSIFDPRANEVVRPSVHHPSVDYFANVDEIDSSPSCDQPVRNYIMLSPAEINGRKPHLSVDVDHADLPSSCRRETVPCSIRDNLDDSSASVAVALPTPSTASSSRLLPATFQSHVHDSAHSLSPFMTAYGASNYWTLCAQAHNTEFTAAEDQPRKRPRTQSGPYRRKRKNSALSNIVTRTANSISYETVELRNGVKSVRSSFNTTTKP